jgi:hypothetical protein
LIDLPRPLSIVMSFSAEGPYTFPCKRALTFGCVTPIRLAASARLFTVEIT